MARDNYSFEKRQRELIRKKKKEEKRQLKAAARKTKVDSDTTSPAADEPAVD
jgi:hypothetical protein